MLNAVIMTLNLSSAGSLSSFVSHVWRIEESRGLEEGAQSRCGLTVSSAMSECILTGTFLKSHLSPPMSQQGQFSIGPCHHLLYKKRELIIYP